MPAERTPNLKGDSLQGKLLVAMPGMTDPRFHKSVVVIMEHSGEGAMGVIVNRVLEAVQFTDLLEQMEISVSDDAAERPVHFGGPVELGRGFVLHSADVMLGHSVTLGQIGITTSMEMLGRIAAGNGPANSLFCLGYAGWSAGQLDQEMRDNGWLHAPLDPAILFQTPLDKRWDAAMKLAGIDPDFLVAEAGTA